MGDWREFTNVEKGESFDLIGTISPLNHTLTL